MASSGVAIALSNPASGPLSFLMFPMNRYRFGLVLAFLAAFLPGRASARLWETEAQIEGRYGRPLPSGFDRTSFYAFENLAILVQFSNGVSDEESYQLLDSKNALSEPEIRGILEANSDGNQWRQEKENSWSVEGPMVAPTRISSRT
jgi:hypothetical protein